MKKEEAIERIKSRHDKWALDDKDLEALQYVFPELKESEDEKARKGIKSFIEVMRKRIEQGGDIIALRNEDYEMFGKWLDYLEKQKEQKHIDYPYVPGWRKNRDGNKPELKHSVLMLTTHGVAEGEWLGEKWCQYRWSCELKDNEILYWIHLSDLTQLEKEDEIIEKGKKPAEWSEEDEKSIEKLDGFLSEVFCYGHVYISQKDKEELQSWLKSLRPQHQHHDTYYDIIHDILNTLKSIDFTQITPEHRVSLLNDIRVKCKNADECAAILDEPQ